MDMIQNHICYFRISQLKLIKIELLEKINIFKIHRGFMHTITVSIGVGSARENDIFKIQ